MTEIARYYEYDTDGRPMLVLRKNLALLPTFRLEKAALESFAIRMNDIWQYSEGHNPDFRQHMWNVCEFLHNLLDLGLATSQKMARLAWLIQDGIDELLQMPPQRKETKTIGEIKTIITDRSSGDSLEQINDLNIRIPEK